MFLKLGITSFGASTSEVIIENISEKKGWLSLDNIRSGIAVAGLSPGPFHINLVMNLGYQLCGFRGLLLSLSGFILPSFILAYLLAVYMTSDAFTGFLKANPGILTGVLAGISGLLINSIIKLSRGAINSFATLAFTLFLSGLLLIFHIPFISAIIGAGIIFWIIYSLRNFKKGRG